MFSAYMLLIMLAATECQKWSVDCNSPYGGTVFVFVFVRYSVNETTYTVDSQKIVQSKFCEFT